MRCSDFARFGNEEEAMTTHGKGDGMRNHAESQLSIVYEEEGKWRINFTMPNGAVMGNVGKIEWRDNG